MEKHGWSEKRLRESMSKGEFPPLNVIVEAINASNDVTTNFKRMGDWGRYVNKAVPYWNAQLEGMDKMARNVYNQPKRVAIMAAAVA